MENHIEWTTDGGFLGNIGKLAFTNNLDGRKYYVGDIIHVYKQNILEESDTIIVYDKIYYGMGYYGTKLENCKIKLIKSYKELKNNEKYDAHVKVVISDKENYKIHVL